MKLIPGSDADRLCSCGAINPNVSIVSGPKLSKLHPSISSPAHSRESSNPISFFTSARGLSENKPNTHSFCMTGAATVRAVKLVDKPREQARGQDQRTAVARRGQSLKLCARPRARPQRRARIVVGARVGGRIIRATVGSEGRERTPGRVAGRVKLALSSDRRPPPRPPRNLMAPLAAR